MLTYFYICVELFHELNKVSIKKSPRLRLAIGDTDTAIDDAFMGWRLKLKPQTVVWFPHRLQHQDP